MKPTELDARVVRRLPVGAEPLAGLGVHFRVWAPDRAAVSAVVEGLGEFPLAREAGGYFSGAAPGARAGSLYRFKLDGGLALPDPASRFQPDGPHGPSEVIEPGAYRWSDAGWRGPRLKGQVLYELHIGTFTKEGTWAAAARRLPELAELGVTAVEVMPVAEFPGRFNWGYDGVDFFAPTRLYGRPDELRAFVDRAHGLGLAVILDTVYNNFGPDGNYLKEFARGYFSSRRTDWGEAINYDGPGREGPRGFMIANAAYWVSEFHLDGLRLDATQDIHDSSSPHILAELSRAARAAAFPRSILLFAEDEPQRAGVVLRDAADGGWGLDAVWNDDFHHAALVAATGRREAYYLDYGGSPQELVSAAKWGYLYQGQHYSWQRKRRGHPALDVGAERFVTYLCNHDQAANSTLEARGLWPQTSPGRARALTAYWLLCPGTPLLFQGQEEASPRPFYFFADHKPELRRLVADGRKAFMGQFSSMAGAAAQAAVPDPADPATFAACKPAAAGGGNTEARARALHRDLLRLRKADGVFAAQRADRIHGAVLGPEAFALRFFGESGDDRLLVVNLGAELNLAVCPEPLLAPPAQARWRPLWCSDEVAYGGGGPSAWTSEGRWRLASHAACVFVPMED